MALRVLLADESSTIKKVIQLALQDYAVEVRTVNVGLDVLPVAKQFQPDILFADVLLQKKSGYDVSADFKRDPSLTSIPVILMWSGFMELDNDKFQISQANDSLEKPFDVATLRKLIQKYVPKTKTQDMSQFLTLPKTPKVDIPPPSQGALEAAAAPVSSPPPPTPPPMTPGKDVDEGHWNMDNFAPISEFSEPTNSMPPDLEGFTEKPLGKPEQEPGPPSRDSLPQDLLRDRPEDEAGWKQKDLDKFRLNIGEEEEEEFTVDFSVPEEKIEGDDFLLKSPGSQGKSALPPLPQREMDPVPDAGPELEIEESAGPEPELTTPGIPIPGKGLGRIDLPQEKMEAIVREVAEAIVWKVVPDLAAQMIEREIKRLVDENESR